jgi:hypothetical protein
MRRRESFDHPDYIFELTMTDRVRLPLRNIQEHNSRVQICNGGVLCQQIWAFSG